MICIECKGIKKNGNAKFCSILCRNRAVSRVPRRTGKRNYTVCRECGTIYTVKKSQLKRAKYCSRKCQGKVLGRRKGKG